MLNYPVQGTAADIIKESIGQLMEVLPRVKGRLVHCIHDEVVVEVPERFSQEVNDEQQQRFCYSKNVVPVVACSQALELVQLTMKKSGDKYLKHLWCSTYGVISDSWAGVK